MKTCYLNALGMICSLGANLGGIKRNYLVLAQSGVASSELFSPGRPLPVGRVAAILPAVDDLPVCQRSHNNQMALAALAQIRAAVDSAIERYGAQRCGVVIGTSTSGIGEGEIALRECPYRLPAQFHYGPRLAGGDGCHARH
jgi:3-oxoacyl-[acyl-carrier-protein] synthase-1